ncbi:MAG: GGDEF domain-containing protein [Rhodomicrobium sp.]|nr:GGDEF domain-containing protein [Rhodomicrobium sp.]
MSDDLFDRYFANTRLSVQMVETGESISRELEQVVEVLRSAGAQSRSFGEVLDSVSAADTSSLDAATFRQLVKGLVTATAEMALHNQQLSDQMEQSTRQVETLKTALQTVKIEALTDRLTGLANRRLFDETLESKLIEARASGTPLCLLMCDIDYFKRFNDTWGHLVGDNVIRYIASVLRLNVPNDALAARYGGEEFAIILPRTAISAGQRVAEQIRCAVRSKQLSRRSTGESIGAVTVSIGLTEWRAADCAPDLIHRADQCLYISKRNGRDQTTTDAIPARAA